MYSSVDHVKVHGKVKEPFLYKADTITFVFNVFKNTDFVNLCLCALFRQTTAVATPSFHNLFLRTLRQDIENIKMDN